MEFKPETMLVLQAIVIHWVFWCSTEHIQYTIDINLVLKIELQENKTFFFVGNQ